MRSFQWYKTIPALLTLLIVLISAIVFSGVNITSIMQDDKCRVNNCTGSSTEEIPHLIGFLDEDSNLEIVLADTLQAENSRDEAILFYKKVSKRGKQRRSFPSTESLPSYTNDDVMEYRRSEHSILLHICLASIKERSFFSEAVSSVWSYARWR